MHPCRAAFSDMAEFAPRHSPTLAIPPPYNGNSEFRYLPRSFVIDRGGDSVGLGLLNRGKGSKIFGCVQSPRSGSPVRTGSGVATAVKAFFTLTAGATSLLHLTSYIFKKSCPYGLPPRPRTESRNGAHEMQTARCAVNLKISLAFVYFGTGYPEIIEIPPKTIRNSSWGAPRSL